MNLINSKIVSSEQNIFWNDISGSISPIAPKSVLVLTFPYSTGSSQQTTLVKMLQACKLQHEDYQIIMLDENEPMAWHKLKEGFAPKKILLLGVLPAQLGISALFALNQVNNFDDALFIPSLSLGIMEQHPDTRKELWKALQSVFLA